jgi:ferrochelatase
MSRLAVVLFNLGGPDRLAAVRPFLRNLFSDPAILRAPAPVRIPAAELISRLRERRAKENYAFLGGASPLLRETEAQRAALEEALKASRPSDDVRVFVAMRYWRPLTELTAADVAAFSPDEIVLLPLYPQYSTTTTASSLAAWRRFYRGGGRQHVVCAWFDHPLFIESHASAIREAWDEAERPAPVRLLFSAHGIPEAIARAGDPYQRQVERSCEAIAGRLGDRWDWRVCYQSRVGPMRWIGPETREEITQAGRDGVAVVIDPVAFVSEHVETLVELDRDYAKVASRTGVPAYVRVPALGVRPGFIQCLAALSEAALTGEARLK